MVPGLIECCYSAILPQSVALASLAGSVPCYGQLPGIKGRFHRRRKLAGTGCGVGTKKPRLFGGDDGANRVGMYRPTVQRVRGVIVPGLIHPAPETRKAPPKGATAGLSLLGTVLFARCFYACGPSKVPALLSDGVGRGWGGFSDGRKCRTTHLDAGIVSNGSATTGQVLGSLARQMARSRVPLI